MRLIHLKFQTPLNWFELRKLNVYTDSGQKLGFITPNTEFAFKVDSNVKYLKVAMFPYTSYIYFDATNEAQFFIVFINFRKGYFLQLLDGICPNYMQNAAVSKAQFDSFTKAFYHKTEEYIKVNKSCKLMLHFAIAINFLFFPFLFNQSFEAHFISATCFISIISIFIILTSENKILISEYKIRMLAIGLTFILNLFFLQQSFWIENIILSMIFLYFVYYFFHLNKLKVKKEVI